MSVEPYLLFGRLCLKAKLFTAKELRKAVTKQFNDQKTGNKKLFGDVCIELGYITKEQRDEILKKQASEEIHPEATVFGQLAVLNGFVTKQQVSDALRIQKELRAKGSKKRIGEILYSEKLMAPIQVRSILKAQHRIRQGMRSTMYLSREFVEQEADAATKKSGAENIADIKQKTTKDKSKKEDKKSQKQKAIKASLKTPKKPSIDEIEARLKTLENDFGGMFEVSIDEDDAVDVADEFADEEDVVIEPKMIDNEFDESVFKIRKEEQELRRTDQQKLRDSGPVAESVADIKEKMKRGEQKQNSNQDVFVSKHTTEYLADNIVFEQVTEEIEEDATLTRREKEFLDQNISDSTENQIEIFKSDGTTIKPNPNAPKLQNAIPTGESNIPVTADKSQSKKQQSVKKDGLRFKGRISDAPNTLDVEAQKKVPYVSITLITIAIILLLIQAVRYILHAM